MNLHPRVVKLPDDPAAWLSLVMTLPRVPVAARGPVLAGILWLMRREAVVVTLLLGTTTTASVMVAALMFVQFMQCGCGHEARVMHGMWGGVVAVTTYLGVLTGAQQLVAWRVLPAFRLWEGQRRTRLARAVETLCLAAAAVRGVGGTCTPVAVARLR